MLMDSRMFSWELPKRTIVQFICNSRVENLTPREFGILYALVRQSPRAINRSDLFNIIWKQEYPETTRRIDMMVKRLRSKLGEELSKRIKTEGGVGYRFE